MVYDKLVEFLMAETCPGCSYRSRAGFCDFCVERFSRTVNPCEACALERPVAVCPRRSGFWRVDAVVAPFVYQPPLDRYIHALKYRGARSLGRALGLLLADALRTRARAVDAIVAVPLAPRRLRERGYNQAAEIARTLSRELGVPLIATGVRRSGARRSQTGLDARERSANVAHAFTVTRSLAGTTLAVVDDVITTGATVNALAAALTEAGAVRVDAWAIARTS